MVADLRVLAMMTHKRRRNRRVYIIAVSLIVGISLFGIGLHTVGAGNPTPPSEHDQAVAETVANLKTVGLDEVREGLAVTSNVDVWSQSLDLTIAKHSNERAEQMATNSCQSELLRDAIQPGTGQWNVRVYLVDGTLAAQCPISG